MPEAGHDAPLSKHGGPRKNAGRKPKEPRAVHSAGAAAVVEWAEGILVKLYGDKWEATEKERDAIGKSLGTILQRWEIGGIENPYLHLTFFAATYAAVRVPPGAGKQFMEGVRGWLKKREEKIKQRAADKAAAKAAAKEKNGKASG